MRILLASFFILLLVPHSQAQLPFQNGSKTWALIVGVSDYADASISDLQFAHLDALAFRDFLQSPQGGAVPASQIELLINEEATQTRIFDALGALTSKVSPGDQVYFYFSGHGDVETVTSMNMGYLLAHNTIFHNYPAGAIPLYYLEAIVNTLSQKEAKVVLITDACRSGKLAGMEIGGPQVSAAFMRSKFQNEVKIMACRANQYSIEGIEWGGGHGAFTFHLLQGMQGLADEDQDYQVSLFELEDYLKKKVRLETAPNNQIPDLVYGDPYESIASIDPAVLAKLEEEAANRPPLMAMVETKGVEDMVLSKADSSIVQTYTQFQLALEEGRLLYPAENCAYHHYKALEGQAGLELLEGLMRRNLSVSLQEEAQEVILEYLEANPEQIAERLRGQADLRNYPEYLARALELLGKGHFMRDHLYAKQLYFEVVVDRLGAQTDLAADVIKLQEAIELLPEGAFLYNELGLVYSGLEQAEEERKAYEKAHALAPKWVMPLQNLAIYHLDRSHFEEATEWNNKALEVAPDFALNYNHRGIIHLYLGEYDQAVPNFDKAIELDDSWIEPKMNRALVYYYQGEYDKAEKAFRKLADINPEDGFLFYNWALCLSNLERWDKAEEVINQALSLEPDHPYIYAVFGNIYFAQERYAEAVQALDKNLARTPEYLYPWVKKAEAQVQIGNLDAAVESLEAAVQAGFTDIDSLQSASFSVLAELPAYQALFEEKE